MSILERLRPQTGFLRTGHRGARALAPENTLASFELATELGVDVLEMDVRVTADGHVVVIHDETVDRTTSGRGNVHDLTLDQVQALDAGHHFTPDEGKSFPRRGQGVRVPLLREVLAAFPEHLFTVELKGSPDPEYVEKVLAIVEELAPERAIVASFALSLLRRVRRLAPQVPTNLAISEIRRFFLLSKLRLAWLVRSPGRVLQVPTHSNHDEGTGLRVVTRGFVRAAHRGGRSVQVWTINDPDEMRELITMGVDGITTDRPDLLNEVLRG